MNCCRRKIPCKSNVKKIEKFFFPFSFEKYHKAIRGKGNIMHSKKYQEKIQIMAKTQTITEAKKGLSSNHLHKED